MTGAWTALVALALLNGQATDPIVVTAAPALDTQRLADALRVYLDEFGIQVQAAPAAAGGDLRARLDDARRVGEAARAVAVIRAEPSARGEIELEVIDRTTDKVVVVSVPRPGRDEDLYRTLALKIQAVLRATLSEAEGELDPESSLGRLVAGTHARVEPAPSAPALALDVGYGVVSFPAGGPVFGGLAVRGAWQPLPRFEVAIGTAALGGASASSGDVTASATVVPIHVTARRAFDFGRGGAVHAVHAFVGPCVDATFVNVSTSSTTTPVRSARNVLASAGAEAEGRVIVTRSAWVFVRLAALGVLNGERYEVAGVPVLDTSRLQLSASIGAGLGLP